MKERSLFEELKSGIEEIKRYSGADSKIIVDSYFDAKEPNDALKSLFDKDNETIFSEIKSAQK